MLKHDCLGVKVYDKIKYCRAVQLDTHSKQVGKSIFNSRVIHYHMECCLLRTDKKANDVNFKYIYRQHLQSINFKLTKSKKN